MGRPLFIPLKSEFYDAFLDGSKTVEYRRYGRGWNEITRGLGRLVVLSKGYGIQHRCTGVITGFEKAEMDSPDWISCYGKPGLAACIRIQLKQR